eukprot:366413-Chlamydomonas_euryale.AAC.8
MPVGRQVDVREQEKGKRRQGESGSDHAAARASGSCCSPRVPLLLACLLTLPSPTLIPPFLSCSPAPVQRPPRPQPQLP